MVRFTPKQQISMVFMEIARIAVSVKIPVLAETMILVKIMVSKENTRNHTESGMSQNLDIP